MVLLVLGLTQMVKSRVGNTPSNSSTLSIVSLRKLHTEFIIFSITSSVFCKPVIPLSSSSFLQSIENTSSPSCHLQPRRTGKHHSLMSSMYLCLASRSMLDVLTSSNNCLSHQVITSLAMQHVLRSPMGPPCFWRKYFPPKV